MGQLNQATQQNASASEELRRHRRGTWAARRAATAGADAHTSSVIVEVSEDDCRHDIGIMVDAVSEVLEIPASEIEPPPSFGARIRADFIQGMGKVAGKFVILLNISRVLSVDEIAMLASVAGEGTSPASASSV
jgi:chemotaxis signal transduction protein